MKDWEVKKTVSPVWNNGYQRYDLSIDEIIEKIIESGYTLEKVDDEEEEIIDDNANYILEIHSKNGTIIGPDTALVLSPKVYKNGEDITELLDMKYFKWIRSSSDTISDAEWNLRHAAGIKDLYISHEDVYQRAVFHCAFLTGASEVNFVTNMYAAYKASIDK